MFFNSKAEPWYKRLIGTAEKCVKRPMFDCSMCGQCILKSTGLACPMRCPKQMRNGPCGGTMGGKCEVYPDRECAWHRIWNRSAKLGRRGRMQEIQPAVDWRLWSTASWWNLLTGRIDGKGHSVEPKDDK